MALLFVPEQWRRRQRKKLLQPVLDVVVAAQGEEDPEDLVDGQRQAVDVVLVAVELGLKRGRDKVQLGILGEL